MALTVVGVAVERIRHGLPVRAVWCRVWVKADTADMAV